MTNKRIIFKRKDGGVSITAPTKGINNAYDLLIGSGGYPVDLAEKDIKRHVDIDGKNESDVRPFYEGLVTGGFTEDESLNLIAKHAWQRDYLSFRITEKENIPTSRFFRNAWNDETDLDTVDIDLLKCKEIKKHQFRKIRRPKLEELDVEMMRKIANGDAIFYIEEQKQKLRDVTDVVMPDDVAKLEKFMPSVLEN